MSALDGGTGMNEELREEGRTPGEIPYCAGRQAVAHKPVAMRVEGVGWKCPVCGELDEECHACLSAGRRADHAECPF